MSIYSGRSHSTKHTPEWGGSPRPILTLGSIFHLTTPQDGLGDEVPQQERTGAAGFPETVSPASPCNPRPRWGGGIHTHMCVQATIRGGEEMVSRPRVLPTNLHELYLATSRPLPLEPRSPHTQY